jgi:nicotinamidase-related amidase
MCLPTSATLIVIDVQEGFDATYWGERNNPGAEHLIERLLARWRASKRPVIHVRHDSTEPRSALRPDTPGNAIKKEAAPKPGEAVLGKRVNSAFIGTDLEARLEAQGSDTVVLCGFTTNHCVSTTARMASNLGFRTFVLSDCTVAFATQGPGPQGRLIPAAVMHEVGLAELHGEFATIVTTDELLTLLAAEPDVARSVFSAARP